MDMPDVRLPIDSVELQEFLFSTTDVKKAVSCLESGNLYNDSQQQKLFEHLRKGYRLHRFMVLNWLMMNGVQIPLALLSDEVHPEVGKQYPDQKVGE